MFCFKAVSAAELGPMLEKLKPNLTEVCYSREDPMGEPPADMPKVLDAMAALRLPVSFYTDSSFSRKFSCNETKTASKFMHAPCEDARG